MIHVCQDCQLDCRCSLSFFPLSKNTKNLRTALLLALYQLFGTTSLRSRFTVDNTYIACPYTTTFRFIADIPYSLASKVLDYINKVKTTKRSIAVDTISSQILGYGKCNNPLPYNGTEFLKPKSLIHRLLNVDTLIPGYTIYNNLSNDSDNTPYSEIPEYTQPAYV